MQPGSYPPGNDPYGQQPYQDPYGQQPGAQGPYGQPQPDPYAQPQPDPYAQPQPGYGDPYAPQYPTSASPYPTTGGPYQDPYQQQMPQAPPVYPQQPVSPYQQQVPGYGGYTVPGYAAPAAQNNTPGLLSMVFGILSLPLVVCCWVLSLGFGVAAVVLGIIGIRKAAEGSAGNRGQAIAGIICGGIALALSIVFFAVGIGMSVWNPS